VRGFFISGSARLARLNTLKPRLTQMPMRRVSTITEERDTFVDWRKWYKLARWKAKPHGLRWRVLLRDLFTCQMCGKLEGDTSQLVADHKIPHGGDDALFWSEHNVWCVCKPCHDGAKQRQETAYRRKSYQ
jgi:5-methylcytosine-specific restriction enzyme A